MSEERVISPTAGGEERLHETSLRPRSLEEFIGQVKAKENIRILLEAAQGRGDSLDHVLLYGPPGLGKTTLAHIIAQEMEVKITITSGPALERAGDLAAIITNLGARDILFIDEVHRFNKIQQDAFLPHVESGLIILIGATTQNPSFEIIPPLLSRARVMILHPLEREDLGTLLDRAIKDKENGLGKFKVKISPEALGHLIDLSTGDARVALNNLEAAVHYVLADQGEEDILDLRIMEEALSKKALPYDKEGEEHYNLISAFHKSMRGGDEQASLYWLYRMLVAGEDPLFIGRRMIRFASEDVGLADPNALRVALSAFEAWEKVGPPEAELALAEAAVYLASAPKSNALYLAEKAVKKEIDLSGPRQVPLHIRNAPTGLMKKLGYGQGYLYPHNYPGGWVEQEYLPKKIRTRTFYRPTERGFEREIRKRMAARRKPKREYRVTNKKP